MELDLMIILFLPLRYYLGVWMEPYNAWAITLIMAYCVFLLKKKKHLSVWSFLIIGFGTFILRIGNSYYNFRHYSYVYSFGDYFVQRRNLKAVIYLAVLTFFFYFNFAYEYVHVVNKPNFYQKIYDFWLSVIPEFRIQ